MTEPSAGVPGAILDDAALDHVAVLRLGGDHPPADSAADAFLAKPFNGAQQPAAITAVVVQRAQRIGGPA